MMINKCSVWYEICIKNNYWGMEIVHYDTIYKYTIQNELFPKQSKTCCLFEIGRFEAIRYYKLCITFIVINNNY